MIVVFIVCHSWCMYVLVKSCLVLSSHLTTLVLCCYYYYFFYAMYSCVVLLLCTQHWV